MLFLLAPMLTPTTPPPAGARGEPREGRRVAAVVEAVAIDERFVARQAEDARARVARLRPGRQRADLGEAQAKGEQRVRHLGVLVKAGGDAERVGKGEAERLDREARVVRCGLAPRAEAQRAQRQPVRRLGVEPQQERMQNGAERADQARPAGKT